MSIKIEKFADSIPQKQTCRIKAHFVDKWVFAIYNKHIYGGVLTAYRRRKINRRSSDG